jgi:hypothetical protein
MKAVLPSSASSIEHPAPAATTLAHQKAFGVANSLWNQKDFIRVRILYFRSRREAFHIDIFARRVRTLDEMRFARNGNSIRIIPLCDFRRCGGRRRWSCCSLDGWCTCRLNRAVRIERLLRWRVLIGLGGGVARGPLPGRWWLRLFTA